MGLTLAKVLSLALFLNVYAENCPYVKVAENFNLKDYMGTWYEQYRIPRYFEGGATDKCCIATFFNLKGNSFNFNSTQTHADGTTDVYESLSFNIAKGIIWEKFINYEGLFAVDIVIDFDPKNHAVIYACIQGKPALWIFTRDRIPKKGSLEQAFKAALKNGFTRAELIKTEQNNCDQATTSGSLTLPSV